MTFNRIESLGVPTNRPLIETGEHDFGALSMVGLTLNYIRNKSILDVGIGGGESLRQAIELGLNYQAIDILPAVDTTLLSPTNKPFVEIERRKLLSTIIVYPDKFTTANAVEHIPHTDSAFQVVMSAAGVPEYARDTKETINSILEMVRVSSELVAFPGGWNETYNPEGIITLGDGFHRHRFRIKLFLSMLSKCGISYEQKKITVMSLHLDTSNKDTKRLQTLKTYLLSHRDIFHAEEEQKILFKGNF